MNELTASEDGGTAKLIYNDFFEMLPDGVILTDKKGKIRNVNSKANEIFEYEHSELINEQIEILLQESLRNQHADHRNEYNQNPHKKLMSDREILNGRKKNGEQIQVEISLGPVIINNNHFIIAIIRDASVRRHIEQLEATNKELEQFAYFIAHDLQEPLRTITSFTNFLNLEIADQLDDTSSDYLLHISQACHRMENTIKGLLNFSRIGKKLEFSSINCNAILQNVQKDLQSSIRESGTVIEIAKLPKIHGHETSITLLFQNLISNAIKFRKTTETSKINISACKEENYWKFAVEDNGIGIDPQNQKKIFEVFQRLHGKNQYEGTGIGLTHCKKIVDAHGGTIWVESEIEQGSVFHFTIPA